MTVKQFWQKVRVAERVGEAVLPGGCILVCHTPGDWALIAPEGNVIDTSWNPYAFEYICE